MSKFSSSLKTFKINSMNNNNNNSKNNDNDKENNNNINNNFPLVPTTKLKIIDIVKVKHDFKKKDTVSSFKILSLKKGDIIFVITKSHNNWLDCLSYNNSNNKNTIKRGWFPQNFVQSINDTSLKNYHFNKLIKHISLISPKPSRSPSSSLSSTSTSSLLSYEEEGINSKEDLLNNYNNIKPALLSSGSTHDKDPLAMARFVSTDELESLYYNNNLPNDSVHSNLPVFWEIIINNNNNYKYSYLNHNNKAHSHHKIIYFNKDLNIYCYKLPVFINPHSESKILSSHDFIQPVLAKDSLFYHHDRDLKYFADLFENALYYSTLIQNTFQTRDKLKVWKAIKQCGLTTTYICSAIRLLEGSIVDHAKGKIKSLLKSIIKSLAFIKLNSSTYFTNNISSQILQQQPCLNAASLNTTRNASINSTNTLTQPIFSTSRITSTATNRTNSVISKNNSLLDIIKDSNTFEACSDFINSLDLIIDKECNKFKRSIQLIFYYLQNSKRNTNKEDSLLIPQIIPRLFQNSFSGGAWTNPFSGIGQSERNASSSSDHCDNQVQESRISMSMTNPHLKNNSVTSSSSTKNTSSPPIHTQYPKNSVATNTTAVSSTLISVNKRFNDKMYPLNKDTLNTMQGRREDVFSNVSKYIKQANESEPNIQKILKTYTELNENILNIVIIEHLDLSFFVNLKEVLFHGNQNDETIKLLKHSSSTISSLITQFFEVKQAFHDILIDLTMATQIITTEDPYAFSSMKTFHNIGYFENFEICNTDLTNRSLPNINTDEEQDLSNYVYKLLNQDDNEYPDMIFTNPSDLFKYCYVKYYDINFAACGVVEKLIEEKENIINYAARTMQDELIEVLQKDEYKDATWFETDFVNDTKLDSSVIGNAVDESNEMAVPWYLKSEFHNDLRFNKNTRSIKAGSIDALVDYLTFGNNDGKMDKVFSETFLLTFRSIFPSTIDFLLLLINKYQKYPPEGLTFNEYNEWIEKRSKPIKSNVVKLFQVFFKRYWTPSYWEDGINLVMTDFIKLASSENIMGSSLLMTEFQNISNHYTRVKATFSNPLLSKDFISQNASQNKNMKTLKLGNIPPEQFAQQITLINYDIYSHIKVFEYMDKIWSKSKNCDFGGSPFITSFIEHANHLTNYVSYMIISQSDTKKRIKMITYFINVASHCQKLSNFATLTAIISALYSSPVYRLQKTWAQVSDEYKDILEKLDNLMDSKKNFINYRECLRSIPKNIPSIPFFGVYLSDLTFANNGNKDSPGIINFRKRTIIADIIRDIERFQKRSYSNLLSSNEDIQSFISESLKEVPDLEMQYESSLKIEPRNPSTSDVRTKHSIKFWRRRQGLRLFG